MGIIIYFIVLLTLTLVIIIIYIKKIRYYNIDFKTSIYFINMDKSKDRLKHMNNQLSKHKLIGIRFEGVDGKKLNLNSNNYKYFLKNIKNHFIKRPDRIGHLGCFLSHLGIYNKFINSDKEYCLILEDDCSISNVNFKKNLNNSIKYLKNNDIVLLGYHIDKDWNLKHKYKNKDLYLKNGIIYNINYFTGLHCYLINKSTATKLINYLSQPNWYIDCEISKLAYKKKLKIVGIFPPIVCQPAAFKVNVNDINYNYKCKYFKTTTN